MSAKRITVYFFIIFLLSLIAYYKTDITGQATHTEYEREEAFVERVIDGDTIELDSGGHVRLLGINNKIV